MKKSIVILAAILFNSVLILAENPLENSKKIALNTFEKTYESDSDHRNSVVSVHCSISYPST